MPWMTGMHGSSGFRWTFLVKHCPAVPLQDPAGESGSGGGYGSQSKLMKEPVKKRSLRRMRLRSKEVRRMIRRPGMILILCPLTQHQNTKNLLD
jgi:hypothetical protein